MQETGRIKIFNQMTGFGFIVNSERYQVFFSYEDCSQEVLKYIHEGLEVRFNLVYDDTGARARNVSAI